MSTKDFTTNMATEAVTPQPKTNFLSLPGEIRNIIYQMVLTTQYTYDPVIRGFGQLETNLLLVNRKVRTESSEILYGANIWVHALICASEAVHTSLNANVPRPTVKCKGLLRRMGDPALLLKLEVKNEVNNGETSLKIGYFLTQESIGIFVQWLWTVTSKDRIKAKKARIRTGSPIELPITSSHLSLCLYKSHCHSRTKLQEICLKPFALVGTLASINIRGDIDPTVQQKLLKRMKSRFRTAKSAIWIGNDHLQRGDVARGCGDHLEACNLFDHGHLFVCHAAEYLWAISKVEADAEEMRILSALRNVLRSRLARALLYIGQFKPAMEIARNMMPGFELAYVDRLSVTLCYDCAKRGLDGEYNENALPSSAAYDDFIFILELTPRASIRTYFETFPCTDKGLEAKWIEVAVGLHSINKDVRRAAFEEGVDEAIMRAQNELLRCIMEYQATLPGPPSNIVREFKRQLLLKR